MSNEISRLVRFIVNSHNLDDLESLCLDLSIDSDELDGNSKTKRIRSLVKIIGQRKRFHDLLQEIDKSRPHLSILSEFELSRLENSFKDFSLSENPLENSFSSRFSPPSPPWFFTGRKELMKTLKEDIADNISPLVLQGMAGVGKTMTIMQLVHELYDEFSGGILWAPLPDFNGNHVAILRSWVLACGGNLNSEIDSESLIDITRNNLALHKKQSGPILIVIDDVRLEWISNVQKLQKAIPHDTALIFTTRDKSIATSLGAKLYELRELTFDESFLFLKKLVGEKILNREEKAVRDLFRAVGYLPLAIELAGKRIAFMSQKPGYKIISFVNKISAQAHDALALPGHPGLASVFSITYKSLSSDEQRLFRWIGVFASTIFSMEVLAKIINIDVKQIEVMLDFLVNIAFLSWTEEEGIYSIHPLLLQYAKWILEETGNDSEAAKSHLNYYLTLAEENAKPNLQSHEELELALPEILLAIDNGMRLKEYQLVIDFGHILLSRSDFLFTRGYIEELAKLSKKGILASQFLKDALSEGHFLTYEGQAYRLIGSFELALENFKKSLEISQAHGDEKGQLFALGNLGNAYTETENLREAKYFYRKALILSRKLKDSRAEAHTLGNLGNVYFMLGRNKQALKFHTESFESHKKIGDLPGVINDLGNIGVLQLKLGNLPAALENHMSALSYARKIKFSLAIGTQLMNIAKIYGLLLKMKLSIKYASEALEVFQKIGDKEKEGHTLKFLGMAHLAIKNEEEGAYYLKNAISVLESIDSPDVEDLRVKFSQIRPIQK